MTCIKCRVRQNFHSFLTLGTTKNQEVIWFSKPSAGEEKSFTKETMHCMLQHLDEAAKHPFIWIFDSDGVARLETPNLQIMCDFYLEIKKRYKQSLMKIYVLNMDWKTKTLYNMLLPFLSAESRQRLVPCKEPLELLASGIPAEIVKKVFS